MQRFLNVIFAAILFLTVTGKAQQLQNELLFGTGASPVSLDTLTEADSIATGRNITYSAYMDLKNEVMIWGEATLLEGTFSSIAVHVAMLHGSEYEAGPFHVVDSIDAAGDYDFSLKEVTWWGPNRGFVVRYVAQDTSTAEVKIRGEAAIK